ncbi:unnamed protein product [Cochlearia groenlandica]
MANKLLKKPRNLPSSSSWSLTSLPEEIMLDCLARVPRRYYENLSCVSRKIRSLVRSPELYQLRSDLGKDSVYVCFADRDNLCDENPTYLWFTLRRKAEKNTEEYQLVPVNFPSRYFMLRSGAVAADSKIYFIGGYPKPNDLWILDTRSGKLRQGPTMRRSWCESRSILCILDGRIHVAQQSENGPVLEDVYDLESETWEPEGFPCEEENSRPMMPTCVTLEGKVYARNVGSISLYNLREGRRREGLIMPFMSGKAWHMCVVGYVLFGFFTYSNLMWLDTKRNVWRVVSGDHLETLGGTLYGGSMVEYHGKLAFFSTEEILHIEEKKPPRHKNKVTQVKIWCGLIALDRVGEDIRGTVEWSGVVAIIPFSCSFLHCLVSTD